MVIFLDVHSVGASAWERRFNQFEVSSIPPASLTILELVDKIFDKNTTLIAVKIHDTLGEFPNADFRVPMALNAV